MLLIKAFTRCQLDYRLVEIALEHATGATFEKFAQAFFAVGTGVRLCR